MSEPPVAARATGRAWVALIALALVAGLTLLAYAARRWNWFEPPARTAAAAAVIPDAAPGGATGEEGQVATTPLAAAVDRATLATREAMLAGQLAALEARTATVATDAAGAAAQAGRAESLLVAAAARRQIDHGQPLGYLEEQLRQRFGQRQPRAVAIVIAAARQPVTVETLMAGLEAGRSALMRMPDDDLLDTLRREVATLVVLRRAGTPSPLPVDRLDRARRLLAAGQVAAARVEVEALPGAPAAAGWLAAARRWAAAHEALDLIEAAALTVPAPVPATVAPPPVTTTVMP
jgi:hypothetical protein